MKKIHLLIVSIVVSQLAGIIGSVFTVNSIDSWYRFINKPFFNPPGWIFGPVWILLYTLMGIALYFVWREGSEAKGVNKAVFVFLVHLVFNALWSVIFFGWHMIGFALIDILLIWVMILYLIKLFVPISKKAAYLLVPYLLWVSFAVILNLAIFVIN
ncbi:MAG: TspO/MBR family protein [Parcubacteria group bacterium]